MSRVFSCVVFFFWQGSFSTWLDRTTFLSGSLNWTRAAHLNHPPMPRLPDTCYECLTQNLWQTNQCKSSSLNSSHQCQHLLIRFCIFLLLLNVKLSMLCCCLTFPVVVNRNVPLTSRWSQVQLWKQLIPTRQRLRPFPLQIFNFRKPCLKKMCRMCDLYILCSWCICIVPHNILNCSEKKTKEMTKFPLCKTCFLILKVGGRPDYFWFSLLLLHVKLVILFSDLLLPPVTTGGSDPSKRTISPLIFCLFEAKSWSDFCFYCFASFWPPKIFFLNYDYKP